MRAVRAGLTVRALAAGILLLAGMSVGPVVLAQSVDIPLQLFHANDGVILTINVGINGGPARPYLFDTGSDVFNAYYNNASVFGGLPSEMASAGLPTGTKTLYGDSDPHNEFDANVIKVPYLTFYATPSSSTGITLNATAPGNGPSNFLVNAVYYHQEAITDSTPGLQAAPGFAGYYGIFGASAVAEHFTDGAASHPAQVDCTDAGNPCRTVLGGVLGQAVVPGTTAGYVVSANGLSVNAEIGNGGAVPGATLNGPQATRCAIASCGPQVMLGLTPALLAQFSAADTRRAGLSSGPAFPNSNTPSFNQFPINLTVTVSGEGPTLTLTQKTMLDTGTPDSQLYASGVQTRFFDAGATVTVTTGKPGADPVVYTTTRTGTDRIDGGLPYTVRTADDGNPNRTYLGLGFFLQNSVLFDLAGDAIGYSPNYVTDANVLTTPAAPLTIGANSAPLGLAGVISGAGGLSITPGGSATLSGTNTYTGVTSVSGGLLALVGPGSISASRNISISNFGVFDISGVTLAGGAVVQSLSGDNSGEVWLGANTLKLSNANGTFVGVLDGAGGLTLSAGVQTLSGISPYIGPTTVDGGLLVVNGALVGTSHVQVNAGGGLAGSGIISSSTVTVGAGGFLAPGAPGKAGSSMMIVGDLVLQPGATYTSLVGPHAASLAQVSKTASLAGNLTASFSGTPLSRSYTLLASSGLNGTTFDSFTTVGLSQSLGADIAYDGNNVVLNLTSKMAAAAALPANQRHVASVIDNAFNAGQLPQPFGSAYMLNAGNLAAGLSTLSGEPVTGAQQGAALLMNSFLGLMLDPFVEGRSDPAIDARDNGALAYAGETRPFPPHLDVPAVFNPVRPAPPQSPWSVWGTAYGGSATIGGNQANGTHDVSSGAYGLAAGADYRITPDMSVGFSIAGAGTSWSIPRLGGGQSTAAQFGVYGKTQIGPAYVAAALAVANHWAGTSRQTFSGDSLTGAFQAQSFGARAEAGYRFDFAAGHLPATLSPYAAVEPQTFHAPSFSETDAGGGGLGLSYGQVAAVDTRTELGVRLATSLPLATGQVMSLWTRAAWAHDFVKTPALTASFQTLPGVIFDVSGARPADDSALLSVGSRIQLSSALSLIGKFDGRFADREHVVSGSATLRYAW